MASAGRSRAFQRSGSGGWSIIAVTILLSLIAAFCIFIGTAGAAYVYINSKLPSTDDMAQRQSFQSTFIYDRKGQLLYEVMDPNGGRRLVVPLQKISHYMIDATIATEDPTFYTNPGIDTAAVIRAFYQNITSQGIASGASTITMQLVRNVYFSNEERFERSMTRKIKESVLAYQISMRFTKDDILGMYLNEIPYGNMYYGAEAAAQGYFGKSAADLTLAQAALLAGLPQSPGDYNPLENPKLAKQRQVKVLDMMVERGYINEEQAAKAKSEQLTYLQPKFEIKAPHFTLYVRDLLVKKFGASAVYNQGLRVYTTLDLDMQAAAEKAARDHIATIKSLNANNSAVVAIDPKTAEVLVMMGSVDYYDKTIDGEVNMAISPRQPGSALKPFAYATAIDKGLLLPDTLINDKATTFPGLPGSPPYSPLNHDLKFHGLVPARNALACSLNVPAVLTLQQIGISSFLDTLHNAGVSGLNRAASTYGLAAVLGGAEVSLLDVTYAYSIFPNNGMLLGERVSLKDRQPGTSSREFEPACITKVTDASGKTLYEYQPTTAGKQVIKKGAAWSITSILSDDEARSGTYGRHSFLELSRPAAAKTGTTEYYNDGWTVGYTPDLVVGVWVGNADNSPMKGVYGVSGAGYIWHNFMEAALKDRAKLAFKPPVDTKKVKVCKDTCLLPNGVCETVDVDIPLDLVPTKVSPLPPLPTPGPASPTPGPASPTPGRTPITGKPLAGPTIGTAAVMPNVVGMPEDEARALLEAYRFNVSYTNWQTEADVADKNYFKSVKVGCVLSQQPAAETEIRPGIMVYLAARKN